MMAFLKDFKRLAHPYYWINIILSISYLCAKKLPYVCVYLFPVKSGEELCEIGGRETEILFFLAIIIMIRTRKTGSVTMINYLTSSFIYTKIANLILWSYADFRYGIVFGAIFILLGMVLTEPTYKGPEVVTYFRTQNSLDEELNRDKKITWIVAFYAVWNPACVNLAPIFSQLSAEYALDNLRFGKIDIGRFPSVGEKYHVSVSSLSRQLPTIIMFKNGKEVLRRPTVDSKSKLQKFFFSDDNIKAAFELPHLHKECKELAQKKALANEKKTN